MTITIKPTRTLFALSLVCASACDGVLLPTSCSGGSNDGGSNDGGSNDGGGQAIVHEQPCPDPARAQPPTAELCPPERQIAQVAGDCPVPVPGSDWTVETLFAGMTVPATMEHYCRYLWTGPSPADLNTLPANLGQTHPDCRVSPQSPMAPGLAGPFARAFAEGTQMIPDVDAALGLGAPVDVAIVDTAPPKTTDGQSEHGPAIAAIVARLASGCATGLDEPACRRQVATYLGLPQTVDGLDRSLGGYFGYQTDLAEGIVAAVNGWTNHDHKLIVNLSVGWEPSAGDLDADGKAPTAALASVRDAVALAHCQGALVVAASGNQPNGSCVDQPTGPGSWERLPGWDNKQCLDLGLAAADIKLGAPAQLHAYHPFLHAATPIDWDRQNLTSFRPDSNARLAALGFAGFTQVGNDSYGPLTGSSISTASVSGIAALLWSYYPTLSADAIVQAIYDGGTVRTVGSSPVTANVFLRGQSAPEQHVITACGSLAWACSNHAGQGSPTAAQCQAAASNCSTAYTSTNVDTGAWWTAFGAGFAGLGSAEQRAAPAPEWTTYECERCGQATISQLPKATQIPAEAMGDPWVLPQPGVPPCPVCVIDDDEIYLALDDEYSGMDLNNVTVTLYDAAGGAEYISYGSLPLTSTSVYVLTDSDLVTVSRTGLAPESAEVSMVFTDNSGPRPLTFVAGNEIPVQ